MMTLADYKGVIATLSSAILQAEDPDAHREWKLALVHAQRRVRQIEARVLVPQATE